MSFFSRRRSFFLNFAILFFFLGGWIYSYISPALKGLLAEDDFVLYGTVTHAAVPSIFGGSDIPFFDKISFQINEDEKANFVLYASQELLDDMSEWFSFGAVDAGLIPLEITAARIDDNTFIVHALSSTYGDLDEESLKIDYQVYYAFIGVCFVSFLGLVGFIFLILWLFLKRRPRTSLS